jgi:pilus assembly protein Flp/PilA
MFQKAQALAVRAFVAAKSLSSKRRGASAIEYGLLAGLIAVVIIVAVTAVGTELARVFSDIKSALSTVAT